MEDHIPIRPDRSLLLGRQTSKWSLRDVVFHENNSKYLHIYHKVFTYIVAKVVLLMLPFFILFNNIE